MQRYIKLLTRSRQVLLLVKVNVSIYEGMARRRCVGQRIYVVFRMLKQDAVPERR